MVNVGSEQIQTLMFGEMGIKTVYLGDESIYDRLGAYVYIELTTKENDNG